MHENAPRSSEKYVDGRVRTSADDMRPGEYDYGHDPGVI